jgi:5'-3' exonuclease
VSGILLIDGTGLMVRCNRAGRGRALSHDGQRTGPLLMFVTSLARHLREAKPDQVLITWDGPDALGWRRSVVPSYKCNRAPAPAYGDAERAREMCDAAGLASACLRGCEADDVIAMAIDWARRDVREPQITIVSDDADMHQLLAAGVQQARLSGGSPEATCEWAADFYRCTGERIPMVRALAGDPSDGIHGFPGLGVKRASELLCNLRWQFPPPGWMPDVRAEAMNYLDVLDLWRRPGYQEDLRQLCSKPFPGAARWDPAQSAGIRPLLDQYGMTLIAERLGKGTLW